MADAQTATDNNGQYAFTGLRAGTYGVEISGFDMDEVGFGSVSSSATVGVGESKIISFDGTYLRTAGIMGQVSVEGVGREGVTVTMTGEGEDETDVTDAGGLYGFSKLKAGDYSVAISGFDPDEVEFATTSMNVSVALGETANIPFEGTLLRTSGISGRVSADGMGLDGVTVTLAGAAEGTRTTMDGGQYAFAGLAEGTYVVTISDWNEVAYTFTETSATIVLGDAVSHIENFDGTQTRDAGISGMLFIDEVMQDKMHTAGEPTLPAALAPLVASGALDPVMFAGLLAQARVLVRGPDLNDTMSVAIQADGTFTSPGLVAGTYQVSLPVSDEAAAALAAAGVKSVGDAAVVTLGAGMKEPVNFPFRITMQTIMVSANMGVGDDVGPGVEGVKLTLHAQADGTGDLGEKMTDANGMATFNFARDLDTGPGGGMDHIVFVKVAETGNDALTVTANEFTEIEYRGIDRVTHAPAAVTLANTAVSFMYEVKSNADSRNGGGGLEGWATNVYSGDPEAEDAMPLEDGPEASDEDGMAIFSGTVSVDDLPVTFTVMAGDDQPDEGEMWEQSDALTVTHKGLELPRRRTPIPWTRATSASNSPRRRSTSASTGKSTTRPDLPTTVVATEILAATIARLTDSLKPN